MSYNDVEQDENNPLNKYGYRMQNWPSGSFLVDQNPDYKGQEVNADNFYSVLKGKKDQASGPVLETDENSTIFIFYSGEGTENGLQYMPDRQADNYIWSSQLMNAINYMRENNMYKHIVIYWASDYAEQVFDTLPDNYNVIGIASSGRDEKQ